MILLQYKKNEYLKKKNKNQNEFKKYMQNQVKMYNKVKKENE